MADVLHYFRSAKRPDLRMWLTDGIPTASAPKGTLVDLSSGYTFEFKLGQPGSAATFTKTSGITGAVGAGIEPTGTPNLVLAFTATPGDNLDLLTPGTTTFQVKATTGGLPRFWQGQFVLADVIT